MPAKKQKIGLLFFKVIKIVVFAACYSLLFFLSLGSAAIAAVGISGKGIIGDSAFNNISGATTTVIDVGGGQILKALNSALS